LNLNAFYLPFLNGNNTLPVYQNIVPVKKGRYAIPGNILGVLLPDKIIEYQRVQGSSDVIQQSAKLKLHAFENTGLQNTRVFHCINSILGNMA